MATLRKIALGLLLTTAAVVFILTVMEVWNYRQWDYLPLHRPYSSDLDQRTALLQDRVEILTRRVRDMELLVLTLLGTSGLYAIVFVVSSYFSALSFARQADRSVAAIKDQLGLAMGDLRELKEEAQRILYKAAELPLQTVTEPAALDVRVATAAQRLAAFPPGRLDEHGRLELLHIENAVSGLDLAPGSEMARALAGVYRDFARLYAQLDATRARFYLDRARVLAPESAHLASGIHYDIACSFAAADQFPAAMRALAAAFEHRSKELDDRLATDIEEGGPLYLIAATPPFDKEINDLLLNMSVGGSLVP